MVLGPAEQDGALAVAQGEQRAFLAVHELLDHHARSGRAEPPAQHPLDLGLGVRLVGADGHALARRQAVGLDDIGGGIVVQRRLGLGHVLIDAVARRRDAVTLQEGLGEGFRGFQLRRLGRRTKAGNARRVQPVGQALGQRRFRADHDQVRLHLARQGGQGVGVGRLDLGLQLGVLGHARIARRDDEPRDQRRLGDLPGQGVLTPSGSDEQNVHASAMTAPAARVKRGKGLAT
ncbi:hypothetical protein D3C72_1317720 [compost metagenome]